VTRRIIAVLTVIVAACGGTAEPTVIGDGAVTVETFDDFGNDHFADTEVQAIVDGSSTFSYDTFPATSGPHARTWAACGIYTDEVPEIFSVHSMEHGAVTIHYDPALSPADRGAIEETARHLGSHVVVTPRANLAEPVVLTAWTAMARLGEVDAASITAFWNEYAQRGPERLPCPLEIDQAG
jgi:hypothetical protein